MKVLVVACNSIEVSAIDEVAVAAGTPAVGVIDPGVRAAIRATRNGRVGMIGTEATVASGAYERAARAADPEIELVSVACPAFVGHVEAGDTSSPALREAARGYLVPLHDRGVDTLILGCTHYPLLSGMLQLEMGSDVVLVSSAEETAKDVYGTLVVSGRERAATAPTPEHTWTTTGEPAAFARLAERFLGPAVAPVRARRAELVSGER